MQTGLSYLVLTQWVMGKWDEHLAKLHFAKSESGKSYTALVSPGKMRYGNLGGCVRGAQTDALGQPRQMR